MNNYEIELDVESIHDLKISDELSELIIRKVKQKIDEKLKENKLKEVPSRVVIKSLYDITEGRNDKTVNL